MDGHSMSLARRSPPLWCGHVGRSGGWQYGALKGCGLGPSKRHTYLINAASTFCTFIITWYLFSSHMQRDHIYWCHFHPNVCLTFPLKKGQWAHGCRGAVGDRKSAPFVIKIKCQTIVEHKGVGPLTPAQPSLWNLCTLVGCGRQRCRRRWDNQTSWYPMPGKYKGLTVQAHTRPGRLS